MKVCPLPYQASPLPLFSSLISEEFPILLDSMNLGRYDILTANPSQVFSTHAASELEHVLESLADTLQQRQIEQDTDLPFIGGAIGYWSYDLGRLRQAIASRKVTAHTLPLLCIGLYDWAIITDHRHKTSHYVHRYDDEQHWRWFNQRQAKPIAKSFTALSPLSPRQDFMAYQKRFARVKDYIYDGDCYQVNLAQHFSCPFQGDPYQLYQSLRTHNPAPFGGFMRAGDHDILSCSPERFLEIKQQQVTTKPIKGTRPRSNDLQHDQKLASELLQSEKDRAENLMIVDLLRNDLGRNCEVGSVKVPKLFELESYRGVHHLVSTVTGQLKANCSILQCLLDAFPGGSITGAPKIRAMQIIDELEDFQRHIYCGSLGYISDHGYADSNIAIRTLLAHQSMLHTYAGGGLVADSDCQSEYQETFDKIHLIQQTILQHHYEPTSVDD
jgi:para-aminobenzoate synthetase component 1